MDWFEKIQYPKNANPPKAHCKIPTEEHLTSAPWRVGECTSVFVPTQTLYNTSPKPLTQIKFRVRVWMIGHSGATFGTIWGDVS